MYTVTSLNVTVLTLLSTHIKFIALLISNFRKNTVLMLIMFKIKSKKVYSLYILALATLHYYIVYLGETIQNNVQHKVHHRTICPDIMSQPLRNTLCNSFSMCLKKIILMWANKSVIIHYPRIIFFEYYFPIIRVLIHVVYM